MYKKEDQYRPFAEICRSMKSTEWSREIVDLPTGSDSGFIYEPSVDLIVFFDIVAQTEWITVREGLRQAGVFA